MPRAGHSSIVWLFVVACCCCIASAHAFFLNSAAMQHYLNGIGRIKNSAQNGISHAFNENGLQPTLSEYDFIIVGSGPAGCVLANRLSENPNWKVLLLEAGKRESVATDIPLLAAYFQSTDYNWGYVAEPQYGACFGMIDNLCGLPRGKALGGTSVINYMIYNRGNPRDFDRWAEAGNTGWSYAEVLPYFKMSERANLRGKENSTFHGHSGPLSVEDVPYRSRLVRAFVDGSKQAGHKEVDYNSDEQVGVSYVQATTKRGSRHSASHAYLDDILPQRPNLHVLTSARVTRVLIDARTKRATGVEYVRNRRTQSVRARKEVIVSAGTFNTPQLLQLSGIGPAAELRRIGVPLVHDLPGVGENMYDHMSHFGPTFTVNTHGQSLHVEQLGVEQMAQWLGGRGILSSIGGVEALNFVKTPNSREPSDFPDVELVFVPGSLASDEGSGLSTGMRLKPATYDAVYRPLQNASIDHWSVMVLLFHPKSKGRVELKDNNPFHWPRFHMNYFDDEDDVETLLEGIKATLRIAESPAMQELGARIHEAPLPNCAHLGFGTDDYWRCSIRTLSCTLHHQVGTSKMGPASDAAAVVDPELRVHGMRGLRVADTSIIPIPPTSHTNAVSFMIGEKAAAMVRRAWQGQ